MNSIPSNSNLSTSELTSLLDNTKHARRNELLTLVIGMLKELPTGNKKLINTLGDYITPFQSGTEVDNRVNTAASFLHDTDCKEA